MYNHTYRCDHTHARGKNPEVWTYAGSNHTLPPTHNPLFLLNPGADPLGGAWASHIILQKLVRQYPDLTLVDITNYTPGERRIVHSLYSGLVHHQVERIIQIKELIDGLQYDFTCTNLVINTRGIHSDAQEGNYDHPDYQAGIKKLSALIRKGPVVLICDCRHTQDYPCHLASIAQAAHLETNAPIRQLTWPYAE